MQVILNSEQRELSTRNCLGIFCKEIREIDEFQLRSFLALLLCFQISIHCTCDFFLQKRQIRAVREEGLMFSLCLYKE